MVSMQIANNTRIRVAVHHEGVRFEDVDTNSDWHPERRQRVERLVAQRP
jgi:hypothetical protein